ncbi:MAG TPA: ABC-2 transporter permease [Devosia sp.]|nr:ABC-2 transporter permease [Devosia sp.]
MNALKSWRALIVREFLEHRIPFLYFPLGILGLFTLSALGSASFNRVRILDTVAIGHTLKIFELGYLVVFAVWLAYLTVALFFYCGDAFSADRRNNGMLFWKSMPVTDLKIIAAKYLATLTLFPALIFCIAVVSGLIFYGLLNIAALMLPGLVPPDPLAAATSFAHITAFAAVYFVLALLWYAPFVAWVGGLSTIFGRWSLALAFVIPGVLAIIENMAFFGQGPTGGYIWGYLSKRWQFGLSSTEYALLAASPVPFDARTYVWLLTREIDWGSLGAGLVFAAAVFWLASEYRRRRIT